MFNYALLNIDFKKERKRIQEETEALEKFQKHLCKVQKNTKKQKTIKCFIGLTDEQFMDYKGVDITKSAEGWMRIAHCLLKNVMSRQGKDGAEDISSDFRNVYVQFADMENTLIVDGFIRRIELDNPNNAFPYRITTKGLLLFSVLSDILNVPAPESNEQIGAICDWRINMCCRLLKALNKDN